LSGRKEMLEEQFATLSDDADSRDSLFVGERENQTQKEERSESSEGVV
jgi:hypothetical protein